MAQDPIPWPDEEVTGPPIQSTADLIMRRAAQHGEFEQYEEPADDENDEAGQREGQGEQSDEDAREEAEQQDDLVDEQIEFTLGPAGFKEAGNQDDPAAA